VVPAAAVTVHDGVVGEAGGVELLLLFEQAAAITESRATPKTWAAERLGMNHHLN
jgi:hypothetical protein